MNAVPVKSFANEAEHIAKRERALRELEEFQRNESRESKGSAVMGVAGDGSKVVLCNSGYE